MRSIVTQFFLSSASFKEILRIFKIPKLPTKMWLFFLLPRTLFRRQTKDASFLKKLSPHAAVCRMWWDASPKLSRKGRLAG